MNWIIVRNWERFQHYSDRNPPWIKLYTELNSNDEWLGLSTSARGLLVTIWIECARSAGVVRADSVLRLCGKSARSSHLKALVQAGFIELSASKPLATRARARRDRDRDRPSKSPNHKPNPKGRVTGWRLVRGSHGQTHIPDPQGTDRPPPEVRT